MNMLLNILTITHLKKVTIYIKMDTHAVILSY